ncbi:3-isopropylmalate dehydrogenase [Nymphaea thermarum]|nr:3-isopropylmalate dehydrogenase [Nymphaea thermarum]
MAASIFGRALRCQSTTLFLTRTISSAATGSATTPIRATLFPGDGIGPEIVESVKQVFNAAEVPIEWEEHFVGDQVDPRTQNFLTWESLESVRRNGVGLKGPMATPIAKGHRSLNLALRKELGLHANVRPCYSSHIPSSAGPTSSTSSLPVETSHRTTTFPACKKLWADLEEAGLAVKKESSTSRVPRSERGGEVMCDELLMSAKHAMNPKQQDVINKFMHAKDALSLLQQKGKQSRETWELLKDLDEAMSPPSS